MLPRQQGDAWFLPGTPESPPELEVSLAGWGCLVLTPQLFEPRAASSWDGSRPFEIPHSEAFLSSSATVPSVHTTYPLGTLCCPGVFPLSSD